MLRRTIGIGAAAAAITIAGIVPAAAQTSPGGLESYAAGARATAVDLSVFGEPLTVASTAAGIDSTPKAVASGLALFTSGYSTPKVEAASGSSTEDPDNQCTEVDLVSDTPLNLLGLDIVCVDTLAKVVDNNPTSSATSSEIIIDIEAPDLIADTPLSEVVEEIQGGLGELFGALASAIGPIEQATEIELTGIIDGLLEEIQEGDRIARITVAPTSSTGALGVGVASKAVSNGVVVELLPDLPGGALAILTVGESVAEVVRDTTTGVATPTGHAAVLDVTFPNGLLGGLPALADDLGLTADDLGELITSEQLACGPDNPLEDVLCFTLGTSKKLDQASAAPLGLDFGPNTVGQESSVLGLTLLSAAPGGGIVLNVGHTAAASGSTMPRPLPGGPLEKLDDPLPRTGGNTAMPLTLALLAVGAAGAGLLRRSRTV